MASASVNRSDGLKSKHKRDKRRAIRELQKAVSAKKVNEIEPLILKCEQIGAEVDFYYDKTTALQIAVLNNCKPICNLLISYGANVDQANVEGNSLLNMASWRGHVEIVEILINNNADLDTLNDHSYTALNAVSKKGHTKIAELLCEAGCDVNRPNLRGQSPLVCASWEGQSGVVKILLQAGADITWTDHERRTALIAAAERGHADVVQLLTQAGSALNDRQQYGYTALYYAAAGGHKEIVEHLVKCGADLNQTDTQNKTPFYEAVNNQHLDCVKLLADAGCDVNCREENSKQAPIYIAVRQACHFFGSDMSLVTALISANCDLDVADNAGWTPLYQACYGGGTEIVKLLLDHKATVNVQTKSGDTPLHGAIFGNKLEIIDMLIEAGSKVNAVNGRNELPLYTAIANRAKVEIVKMLLDVGSNTDACENVNNQSPLFAAIEHDYTEVVNILIDSGCDINLANIKGSTPLWVACDKGNEDTVGRLLSCPNIDINAGISEIPLHAAVKHGYTSITETLLEAGCDINKLTDLCESAIFFAADTNDIKMAKLLLKWGANPLAPYYVKTPQVCCRRYRDKHPHFELEPLQIAIRNDSFMMVKLILLGSPRMPYKVLATLRDLVFRTPYAQEAQLGQRLIVQYAHFFTGILSQPRCLQEECRGVIREALAGNPGKKVQELNLPTKLKDYVLLTGQLEE